MNQLFVSKYHYTRDLAHSRYSQIKGLDYSLFRQQIDFMNSNFNIVSMEQVMDAVDGKVELPSKALLLTFDDGYIDNYTFALPVLEEFRVQGSFFIPGKTISTHQLLEVNRIHYILASADINELVKEVQNEMDFYRGNEYAFATNDELWNSYAKANRFDTAETIFVKRMLQTVLPQELRLVISRKLFEKYVGVTEEQLAYELYMSEDQIRTMKRHGMFIGVHGYGHDWMANISEAQMEEDIDMALDVLDEFIDRKHWGMSFPYGNYSNELVDYIRKRGASVGFTTVLKVAEIGIDSSLELPRLDCNDYPPKSETYKSIM